LLPSLLTAVLFRLPLCLWCFPAAPAAVFLQLYGGLPNLMAVRQWVKAQIMQQCQGSLPRLKPDLPPQVRTAAATRAGL
jgi:hypothetical protein